MKKKQIKELQMCKKKRENMRIIGVKKKTDSMIYDLLASGTHSRD